MQINPSEKRLNELESKWMDGSISDDEAREYAGWYNEGQDNLVEIPESFAISKEAHAKRMLTAIRPKKSRKISIYFTVSIAAMFLIVISIWLFEQQSLKLDNKNQTQATRFKNDVAPGHNGAVLTLSNGQKIILDSTGNGLVTIDGNAKVIKKEGALRYDAKPINPSALASMAYNTLATDKGRKWQLTLPDGTMVWLNAASSIRFPLSFIGKERLVEITGEAYFEVKHNGKQPFRVKVENQTIEDIGTSFNVNSYKEEGSIKTTLLEGSIKIEIANTSLVSILKPGQQAEISQANNFDPHIRIRPDEDMDETMAWKNGNFSFRNADINSIMRQVSRWYDVDISYEGTIRDTFVADISQKEPISKLLKLLELTDRVHFRIEGKKVTVIP
jgi:transmembrane sensor